jgi:hypothetical protein
VYLALVLGVYRLAAGDTRRFDWPLLLAVNGALFLLPPAFGQSFLWLSGSVNYLWCDALMAWLFVPFANATFRNRPLVGWRKPALLALGAFLLGNMSENVSACAVLMMGLCALWQWIRHRKVPAWMLAVTLSAFIGWLLLMLAPANRLNVARATVGLNALANHFQAALTMWLQYGLWPSLAFLGLFFFTLAAARADKDRLAFGLGLFVCSLACNFAMTASDYYPERAFTGSVVLLIGAFTVVLGAGVQAGWHQPFRSTLACGLALVMTLQMLGAMPNAYNRYRLAQERVTEVIAAQAAGQTDVETFGIKGITRFDAFFSLNELTDDPQYFPNVYFAKYYGLNSVVVTRFE